MVIKKKELKTSFCASGKTPNYIQACAETSKKDIRAVTTPVTAPMVKEPLNMPIKMPTDLKKAAASKVCVFSPAGW